MTGYIFLMLALIFGLIKAYCGKQTSSAAVHLYDAIVINTVRMVLCILIGVIFILFEREYSVISRSQKVFGIALLCGLGTASFTVCWLLSVRTKAYMLVEVFVMAGSIIPLTLCAALYKEPVSITQVLAISLLLAAVYCMCTSKTDEKVRFSTKSLLVLILCAVSSGISDFSQKLFVLECGNDNISLFNLYVYLFSAVALLLASFVIAKTKKQEHRTSRLKIVKPVLGYISVMSLCLFLNSYFKTLAAAHMDAVLLYPLNQGCAVVLSLAMSVIVFKENPSFKAIIGIALAAAAVILLSAT